MKVAQRRKPVGIFANHDWNLPIGYVCMTPDSLSKWTGLISRSWQEAVVQLRSSRVLPGQRDGQDNYRWY